MNRTGSKSIWRRAKMRICRGIARWRQSATCWAAVGCYAVLALGIPLPMPSAKTAKQPYPCMNHHCGCRSAEECWRHCCCTTLEERLIWARENHVRPPEYALAEARAKGIQWAMNWPSDGSWRNAIDESSAPASTPKSDCQSRTTTACETCNQPSTPAETHTCACSRCSRCNHRPNVQQSDTAGIIVVEALKCHGVGDNWQGLAISLPPPVAVLLESPMPSAERVTVLSLHFTSPSFPPATPPPRLLTAVLS
jgi:hypothetical protein